MLDAGRQIMRIIRQAALAAIVGAAVAWPGHGQAQDSQTQALVDRLGQIEKQMRTLERAVYRGEAPAAGTAATAPAPGAPAQPAPAAGPGRLANAELRMSQIEEQLRQLTGRIEEIRHAVDTFGGRLDNLVTDVDFRLREIEQKARSAPATSPAAAAPAGAPATADQGKDDDKPLAARPSPLPAGTAMERYNYAKSLVLKLDLQGAEAAFQAFLEEHPDDRLASNAYYWLGETYYSGNRLQDAARTFLLGYQKFPDGNKAPDTLLKLGITLRKMGQKDEACATFGELRKNFPQASAQVLGRTDREASQAGCK
jgi:tol-pal system protein YbgF